jgi:hypothetical protein
MVVGGAYAIFIAAGDNERVAPVSHSLLVDSAVTPVPIAVITWLQIIRIYTIEQAAVFKDTALLRSGHRCKLYAKMLKGLTRPVSAVPYGMELGSFNIGLTAEGPTEPAGYIVTDLADSAEQPAAVIAAGQLTTTEMLSARGITLVCPARTAFVSRTIGIRFMVMVMAMPVTVLTAVMTLVMIALMIMAMRMVIEMMTGVMIEVMTGMMTGVMIEVLAGVMTGLSRKKSIDIRNIEMIARMDQRLVFAVVGMTGRAACFKTTIQAHNVVRVV